MGLFGKADCQAKFVDVWREIAKRYKNAKAIWGYDLVNEPIEDAVMEGTADWQELAERAAKAIREIALGVGSSDDESSSDRVRDTVP